MMLCISLVNYCLSRGASPQELDEWGLSKASVALPFISTALLQSATKQLYVATDWARLESLSSDIFNNRCANKKRIKLLMVVTFSCLK